jgi:hypothetical protein
MDRIGKQAEPALRGAGRARGDIIKTMHRARWSVRAGRGPPSTRYVLHTANATERIVGRVLDKAGGGGWASRFGW